MRSYPPRAAFGGTYLARVLLAISWSLLLELPSAPAAAARPVRVWEVSVRATDSAAALDEAMRDALVRATGQRDAGTDPVFQTLVANAARYVRSSHSSSDGTTQVVFDGAALEREIAAAGRSVWDSERPFTVVVLSPALTGGAADAARRALEDIAERRGLPITLVPMAVADAAGTTLSADALLQNAQRLGADAVLLGRADAGASPAGPDAQLGQSAGTGSAATANAASANPAAAGAWQWTLVTGFTSESWRGAFDSGVNGAADALARVEDSSVPLVDSEALVEVGGVTTLTDYAAVERILSGLPGVRRAGLEEAAGTTATFQVLIRGGAEAVQRALANSARLEHTGVADARLQYQLRP